MRKILESLSIGLSERASLTKREILLVEEAVFTESLVNSLTSLYQRQHFRADIHNSYRQRVTDHFNGGIYHTVTRMMAIIDPEIEEIFQILKLADSLNRRNYMDYAKDISMKYAEEDFEPRKFLYFCVHVTKLAMCFYSEGVRQAHGFAFQAVLYGFRACEKDRMGWSSFKYRAEYYSPSTEAVVNSSCVTTVCDSIPTIDSVQGLSVTSDEASSSEGTTSEDEDNAFFRPRPGLLPVGEAASTYFSPFENRAPEHALNRQTSCGLHSEHNSSDGSSDSESVSSIFFRSAENPA